MQKAETVINVIQNRGAEGKPLDRLYRQLFNLEMYKKAYSEIYANKGATTPGVSNKTLDGMSEKRMNGIIQKVKTETYRWQPARRTYIPKESGGQRPLGVPEGNDKLLQATMKILLEAYYEPQFSKRSHGFRRGKGCQTALMQIGESHRDTSWFIEGDIKGCFDNIDHEILLKIMERKIEDQRFIRLVKHLLKAGYMEEWEYYETFSGTPQGGTISPLLANIYLDVFDKWVENELMPLYNRGRKEQGGRKRNPEYRHYEHKRRQAKEKGDVEAYKKYGKLMKNVPSVIEDDTYRKLEYIRYADDFLLSFAGPKKEAEEIKGHIRDYLERELSLELSDEKTLITHARSGKANFLGYELCVMQSNERRSANGSIWYGIPKKVIKEKVSTYSRRGKIIHKARWLLNSDIDIIAHFQSEYRGLVQYYIMAHNIHLLTEVRWAAETSMLKTLASKHKSTVNKMVKKYQDNMRVDGKTYKVFKVVVEREEGKKPLTTHFGAIPLKRNPRPSRMKDNWKMIGTKTSQLIDRMDKEECEMCGSTGDIEVHHVRKLKDVKQARKKRKTGMGTSNGCHQKKNTNGV